MRKKRYDMKMLQMGLLSMLVISCVLAGCKKFLQVPAPETELVASTIFQDESTANSALAAIYASLSGNYSFASGGTASITYFEGVYADELNSAASANSTSDLLPFYLNNVNATNGLVSSTWAGAYQAIYQANRMIEGVEGSVMLSAPVKNKLKGEALFIRAFCHFYLVNLFGDVPLVLTAEYVQNTHIARTPEDQVYSAIVTDLLQAEQLLGTDYPSAVRARVNKGAAEALLARVYLYREQYAAAEAMSTRVIGNALYDLLPGSRINEVFLSGSKEAIWQLLPGGGNEQYTYEGFSFILQAPPASGNVTLSNSLAAAFEAGDLRRKNWVDSITSTSGLTKWYFAHKYKESYLNATGKEASMVLRIGEQYLIRAEARAMQDKLADALTDLNAIRSRAGLLPATALSKDQLLTAIQQQRRLELFTEWGHRFFDLKRTGKLDEVLKPVKGNWDSNDRLLPLPLSELRINSALTQNPGY